MQQPTNPPLTLKLKYPTKTTTTNARGGSSNPEGACYFLKLICSGMSAVCVQCCLDIFPCYAPKDTQQWHILSRCTALASWNMGDFKVPKSGLQASPCLWTLICKERQWGSCFNCPHKAVSKACPSGFQKTSLQFCTSCRARSLREGFGCFFWNLSQTSAEIRMGAVDLLILTSKQQGKLKFML